MVEIFEILLPLILKGLEAAIISAAKEGLKYIVRKMVDGNGNTTVKICSVTAEGNGSSGEEQEIFTLPMIIPDLSSGYCLCNKGDEIGLGMPQYRLVDISDIITDIEVITGNDDGFIIDFDGDGDSDDILIPLPDFDGDGQGDWGWLVDDDDNGLPDVSPDLPFYPVGSEGYTEIVSHIVEEEPYTIMNKPIFEYTVTEGILLIFLIVGAFKLVGKAFRRKRVVK